VPSVSFESSLQEAVVLVHITNVLEDTLTLSLGLELAIASQSFR